MIRLGPLFFNVSLLRMSLAEVLPATTTVSLPPVVVVFARLILVSARSAPLASTLKVVLAWLLLVPWVASFGSAGEVELMSTVAVALPGVDGAVVVIWMSSLAPLANVPLRLQVTVWPLALHDQPGGAEYVP